MKLVVLKSTSGRSDRASRAEPLMIRRAGTLAPPRLRSVRRLAAAAQVLALPMVLALQTQGVMACTACYGQSDAPMARGMNYGIFSLLAVVVVVLGAVASFFVYLGKRAAAMPPETGAVPGTGTTADNSTQALAEPHSED